MKKVVKWLSIIAFLSATVTVAGVCYEGMVLKWFSWVGTSIIITDAFFLIASLVGVFYYKEIKMLFYSHLFSIFLIMIALALTLTFGKNIPKFLFLLWEFYILYFYGIIVCKKMWQKNPRKS